MFDIIKMENGEYSLTENDIIIHCDCLEGVALAIPDFISDKKLICSLKEKLYNM